MRDPDHPRYADCTPPASFSKRFPALTLKKALKQVSKSTLHESPNVIKRQNPVTGTLVNSENLYAQKLFGVSRYGDDHTFAAISQTLEGPKSHSIVVSNTNYTSGSKDTVRNELAEIYIRQDGQILAVPLTAFSESGYCSASENGPDSCFSTGYAHFDVDEGLFGALARSDPQEAVVVTARRLDGNMAECPLYFSPLSFKSVEMTIDESYNKAAAKREKQIAQGF